MEGPKAAAGARPWAETLGGTLTPRRGPPRHPPPMPNANANPNPYPDPPLMRQTLPVPRRVLCSSRAKRAGPPRASGKRLGCWSGGLPHGRTAARAAGARWRGHGGGGEATAKRARRRPKGHGDGQKATAKRARRRGHGGGGELDSPCPFGRAAGLVEEQDSPLVAAAVAIVGRAEDGDNVLVVAPGVPG